MDYYNDADLRAMYEAAADHAARILRQGLISDAPDYLVALSPPLESPIEAKFFVWWWMIRTAKKAAGELFYELDLFQQQRVTAGGNNYRLDFVVAPESPEILTTATRQGRRWPNIAVELDGHDFHERTKEQVAERNQRDRDLQADGWIVFHFSGSELYRDPARCVTEVMDFASKHLFRIETDSIRAESSE